MPQSMLASQCKTCFEDMAPTKQAFVVAALLHANNMLSERYFPQPSLAEAVRELFPEGDRTFVEAVRKRMKRAGTITENGVPVSPSLLLLRGIDWRERPLFDLRQLFYGAVFDVEATFTDETARVRLCCPHAEGGVHFGAASQAARALVINPTTPQDQALSVLLHRQTRMLRSRLLADALPLDIRQRLQAVLPEGVLEGANQ